MCAVDCLPEADALMRARFEQSHLPLAIAGLDMRLVAVNEAMGRLLGRPVNELIGVRIDCLTSPETPSSRASELLESGASGELDNEGVCTEHFRAIVESAREGIWVANPQGHTVYVNQKMADIVGLSIEDLHTRGVFALLDCEDTALMRRRLLDQRSDGSEDYEVSVYHADGSTRCLKVRSSPLWDAAGEYVGSLGMVSDITELTRVQHELRRQALYDQVTQLPNRTLLEDRLEQARDRYARGVCSSVALLILDVDQFKLVNESVGHAAGDRLLAELATRLAAVALPGETVARFGGDEFVVLAEDVSADEAQALADRMLAALAWPFDMGGRSVHVTASVGIATSEACAPAELLQSADVAIFVAKRRGSGETQMFDHSLATETWTIPS